MKIDATSLPRTRCPQALRGLARPTPSAARCGPRWIGNDGKATLTIPADLMGQFQDIEVSVQRVGADGYDYSGTSVLRGSYA